MADRKSEGSSSLRLSGLAFLPSKRSMPAALVLLLLPLLDAPLLPLAGTNTMRGEADGAADEVEAAGEADRISGRDAVADTLAANDDEEGVGVTDLGGRKPLLAEARIDATFPTLLVDDDADALDDEEDDDDVLSLRLIFATCFLNLSPAYAACSSFRCASSGSNAINSMSVSSVWVEPCGLFAKSSWNLVRYSAASMEDCR